MEIPSFLIQILIADLLSYPRLYPEVTGLPLANQSSPFPGLACPSIPAFPVPSNLPLSIVFPSSLPALPILSNSNPGNGRGSYLQG